MTKADTEHLYIYDTTLRDGQQTLGIDFSSEDKIQISQALDSLGIDYIEGGWPGANPTDSSFFQSYSPLNHATMCAFGMTVRAGLSASEDPIFMNVINANTPTVCIVGKSHAQHVTDVLRTTLKDNIQSIKQSITEIRNRDKEAIFDAEHFFDAMKFDRSYALDCLSTAIEYGARWVVLCDTNGGTQPLEVMNDVKEVCKIIPGSNVGIHAHNDTGQAVAISLMAVIAGARQIQGTINGIGERCGNADLTTIIPTLLLKPDFKDNFTINISDEQLRQISHISTLLNKITNCISNHNVPYIGRSAFSHKAGLHASAVIRSPSFYEHIDPKLVGNSRIIPISKQAGKSSILWNLENADILPSEVRNSDKIQDFLHAVKKQEDKGYSYDMAHASLLLFARRFLYDTQEPFTVISYNVTVINNSNTQDCRQQHHNKYYSEHDALRSTACITLKIDDTIMESSVETSMEDNVDTGPIHALSLAVFQCINKYHTYLKGLQLVDYSVRVMSGGTEAKTRVLVTSIDTEDGTTWTTIGVSQNIIQASFEALMEAITYRILMQETKYSSALK